jgi:hypothetical protein
MGAKETRHASRLLSMAIPPWEKEPSRVAPIDAQILARMEKIDQGALLRYRLGAFSR